MLKEGQINNESASGLFICCRLSEFQVKMISNYHVVQFVISFVL